MSVHLCIVHRDDYCCNQHLCFVYAWLLYNVFLCILVVLLYILEFCISVKRIELTRCYMKSSCIIIWQCVYIFLRHPAYLYQIIKIDVHHLYTFPIVNTIIFHHIIISIIDNHELNARCCPLPPSILSPYFLVQCITMQSL